MLPCTRVRNKEMKSNVVPLSDCILFIIAIFTEVAMSLVYLFV